MIRPSVEEVWEMVRKEGVLTPEVEAQLKKERVEAVQILMDNPDRKDPYQLAASFDDMTDEQLVTILKTLTTRRFTAYMNYLEENQLPRLKRLTPIEKQRRILEVVLDEQDEVK